jgi:hypothetical protein
MMASMSAMLREETVRQNESHAATSVKCRRRNSVTPTHLGAPAPAAALGESVNAIVSSANAQPEHITSLIPSRRRRNPQLDDAL